MIKKKIWLQYYDADGDKNEEVTWCSEPIYDTDICYVLEKEMK